MEMVHGESDSTLSHNTRTDTLSDDKTIFCTNCLRHSGMCHIKDESFSEDVDCTKWSTRNQMEIRTGSEKFSTNDVELQQTDLSQVKLKNDNQINWEHCDNEKPCICSCCYIQLPNFQSFLDHMESHMVSSNNVSLNLCSICKENERDPPGSIANHILNHVITQVTGRCCLFCKKSFQRTEELQRHMTDAHTVSVFRCSICRDIFETENSIQLHLNERHNETFVKDCKHFMCNLCNEKIFHDKFSAELHFTTNHHQQFALFTRNDSPVPLPIFECSFCQRYFKDHYTRYTHIIEEHTPTKEDAKTDIKRQLTVWCSKEQQEGTPTPTIPSSVSLQCAYCSEECKSQADLELHMRAHKAVCARGKHKCNICDETYTSALTLADHKLTHCKIVVGSNCVQCKLQLADEQTFYGHQLQHSGNNEKGHQLTLPANCIVCCQTLQTDVEIKLHARFHLQHLSQRELLCGICKKLFDQQNGKVLNNFVESNSQNISIFLCNICTVSINKLQAKSEINIQSSDYSLNSSPNIECKLCKKLFSCEISLQTHLIEHNFLGMNQFSCYLCSLVFTAATGLQSHIIMEHGLDKKPYECSECQIKFFFRSELDNHMYIHMTPNPTIIKENLIECPSYINPNNILFSNDECLQNKIAPNDNKIKLEKDLFMVNVKKHVQ